MLPAMGGGLLPGERRARTGSHRERGIALAAAAFAALFAAPLLAQKTGREWTIDTSQSKLVVHVEPAGVLAKTLHSHAFQPEQWSGEISWDPAKPRTARVEVHVSADSLHDHQEKLSAKDVAKVEGITKGPAVLDAEKFPKIDFEGSQLEVAKSPPGGKGEFRGSLNGKLTLHGQTGTVGFVIQGIVSADRLEAGAATTFKQSDFGIKPYKAVLGTVAVKDEITLEIQIVALPAERKASRNEPASGSRPH